MLVPAAVIVLGAASLQSRIGGMVWYVALLMLGGLVTSVWASDRHREGHRP